MGNCPVIKIENNSRIVVIIVIVVYCCDVTYHSVLRSQLRADCRRRDLTSIS